MRFARADGSKASNKRTYEEATPWLQMKNDLLKSSGKDTIEEDGDFDKEVIQAEFETNASIHSYVSGNSPSELDGTDNVKHPSSIGKKDRHKRKNELKLGDNASDVTETDLNSVSPYKHVKEQSLGELGVKKVSPAKKKRKLEDALEATEENIENGDVHKSGKKKKRARMIDRQEDLSEEDSAKQRSINSITSPKSVKKKGKRQNLGDIRVSHANESICNDKKSTDSKHSGGKNSTPNEKVIGKKEFVVENGKRYKLFKSGVKKQWFDLPFEENETMTRYNTMFVKREMVEVLDKLKQSLIDEGHDQKKITNTMLTKERKAHNKLRVELLRQQIKRVEKLSGKKTEKIFPQKEKKDKVLKDSKKKSKAVDGSKVLLKRKDLASAGKKVSKMDRKRSTTSPSSNADIQGDEIGKKEESIPKSENGSKESEAVIPEGVSSKKKKKSKKDISKNDSEGKGTLSPKKESNKKNEGEADDLVLKNKTKRKRKTSDVDVDSTDKTEAPPKKKKANKISQNKEKLVNKKKTKKTKAKKTNSKVDDAISKEKFVIENGIKYKMLKSGAKRKWIDLAFEENEATVMYSKYFVRRDAVPVLDKLKQKLKDEDVEESEIQRRLLQEEKKANKKLRKELLAERLKSKKAKTQSNRKKPSEVFKPVYEENELMAKFEDYFVLRSNVNRLERIYEMKRKRIVAKRESDNVGGDLTEEETLELRRLMKKEKRREQRLLDRELLILKKKETKESKTPAFGHKRKRKPASYAGIKFGEDNKMVKFHGYWVKKEAADRLNKLSKKLEAEGATEDEIFTALKNERRKEERTLKRENKVFCFNCRKSGHVLSECPDEAAATNVCFSCGSTEHYSRDCPSRKRGGPQYSHATCFVCGNSGHIARECPDNPRGLYPRGGCCNECGSVEHLRMNCPELQKRRKDGEFFAGMMNASGGIESMDFESSDVNPKRGSTKSKRVVFDDSD